VGALTLMLAGTAEAKVPRKVQGKAYVSIERIRDQAPESMANYFQAKKPKIELTKRKDGHWGGVLVAFFRKDPAHGPITVWLYDKSDKASIRAKEPVNVISVDTPAPKSYFVHDLDINPDLGFNKGRSYLIHVGQIIGKRHKIYARGEVTLR
jgi:hypothetical protein